MNLNARSVIMSASASRDSTLGVGEKNRKQSLVRSVSNPCGV